MNIRAINIYNYNNAVVPPTFGSVKAIKLIAKLESAERLNKVEITFDELERMYEEIGYFVYKKRGSHASVTVGDDVTLSITMPHGRKYVNPNDLKRFLLVKDGKFIEATRVH